MEDRIALRGDCPVKMDEPPGGSIQGAVVTGVAKPSIANGLLCSILKALTRDPDKKELALVIDRDMSEALIRESWTLLFSCFNEAFDKYQKKRIIEINRETTLKMVEDMIFQLEHVTRNEPDSVLFLMPWDYTMKEFESESEYRGKVWEDEKLKEVNMNLHQLECKLDKKHAYLIANLDRWSTSIVNMIKGPNVAHAFSYADIVQGPNGLPTFCNIPSKSHPQINQPQPQPFYPVNQPPPLGVAGHDNRGIYSAGGAVGGQRPRSNSKRRRNEDGSYTEVGSTPNSLPSSQKQQLKGNPNGKQNAKPKPIVGTATGRKMRSPPADIFVLGVHPSTTIDDIVKDLIDRDITIEAKDVVKMLKKEASLCSYKISVRSADLSKALEPSIWPLHVKVREFIHYSKKQKQTGSENSSNNESEASQQDQPPENNVVHDTLRVPVPTVGNVDPPTVQ